MLFPPLIYISISSFGVYCLKLSLCLLPKEVHTTENDQGNDKLSHYQSAGRDWGGLLLNRIIPLAWERINWLSAGRKGQRIHFII